MSIRIGINGFGRIGRGIVRALYESDRFSRNITLVAINEISDTTIMAYLLKYDSCHGIFLRNVRHEHNLLIIDNSVIHILHEREPKKLPWHKLNVDIVLDCTTGVYGSQSHGKAHIAAGAKKVIFSHPGHDDFDATVVWGVNQEQLHNKHQVISCASCTINCVSPVIKLLDEALGITSGCVTSIHSAMHDQQITDSYCHDLRCARAASQSVVPVNTRTDEGISRIFPHLYNCFQSIAVRVPVINVTAIDLSVVVKKKSSISTVNQLLKKAATGFLKDIIDYTELPLVSVDFNHNSHSVIIDGTQTRVSGDHLIKTLLSGYQLRHEADSEEIRFVTRENAENLREYLFWQKSNNSEGIRHRQG